MVLALVAGAAYELSLALRHQTNASLFGDFILFFAWVAMLATFGFVCVRTSPVGLYAPAAALFVTAGFYTSDPFYLQYGSSFQPFAKDGLVAPAWVFTLLGLAFVAGATTHRWRRRFPVESLIVLALLLLTAVYMRIASH